MEKIVANPVTFGKSCKYFFKKQTSMYRGTVRQNKYHPHIGKRPQISLFGNFITRRKNGSRGAGTYVCQSGQLYSTS